MPIWKLLRAVMLFASTALFASPVLAQAAASRPGVKSAAKTAATHVDPCAPIGRTADGKLVYSMSCENLPAPPPPPQAEAREAPAAAPETERTGLFGWSFDRRKGD